MGSVVTRCRHQLCMGHCPGLGSGPQWKAALGLLGAGWRVCRAQVCNQSSALL